MAAKGFVASHIGDWFSAESHQPKPADFKSSKLFCWKEGGLRDSRKKRSGQVVKSCRKKTGSYSEAWNYCASPRQVTNTVTVFPTLETASIFLAIAQKRLKGLFSQAKYMKWHLFKW